MKPLEFKDTDKILVIAPHADDESLGCGGLLLKYGKQCEVVVLTDGSKCGYPDEKEIINIRLQELAKAMSYARVKNYTNLMIEDQKVKRNLDRLAGLSLNKYDYVFVPNMYENHPDHSCIYKEICKLLRFSLNTKIVSYEVWTPLINPNVYLDISGDIERKAELISVYESQLKNRDYTNKMIALNKYRGLACYNDYSEVFSVTNTALRRFLDSFGIERNDKFLIIKAFGLKIKHRIAPKNK